MQHSQFERWVTIRSWIIAGAILVGMIGWVVAGVLLYSGYWNGTS